MSTIRPTLKSAPIVEAIFDVRVEPLPSFRTETILVFKNKVMDLLPVYEQAHHLEQTISFGPNPLPPVEKKTEFARFKSSDGGYICSVQSNGFSLSKIQPYTNWVEFKKTAETLWKMYEEVFSPKIAKRLALRYVNKISLKDGERLEDTFTTYPALSSTLPQEINAFRMNLVLPKKDKKIIATVNQVFDPKFAEVGSDVAIVMFDIDAFANVNFSVFEKDFWNTFDNLHDYKNDVFFESLTEKARKRYS